MELWRKLEKGFCHTFPFQCLISAENFEFPCFEDLLNGPDSIPIFAFRKHCDTNKRKSVGDVQAKILRYTAAIRPHNLGQEFHSTLAMVSSRTEPNNLLLGPAIDSAHSGHLLITF